MDSGALDAGGVAVGPAHNVALTLPKDAAAKVTRSLTTTADLGTGVTKGETLGTATFMLDGKTVASVPVVALADASPASFLTRMQRKLDKLL